MGGCKRASKRARDVDGDDVTSPPVSKQTKIEDFIMSGGILKYAISTSNRFAPLDKYISETQCEEVRNEGDDSTAWLQEGQTEAGHKTSDNILNELSHLTAKTLNVLFERIKHIETKIDNMSQLLAKQFDPNSGLTGKEKFNSPSTISNLDKKPFVSSKDEFKKASIQLQPLEERLNYQLMLLPCKVCLVVCKYKNQLIPWRTKQLAIHHLSNILDVSTSSLDLLQVEPLYNPNQTQRILLEFTSPKIPTLLHRKKLFLRSKGIFPVRVFGNTILKPLLPKQHTSPLMESGSPYEEHLMDLGSPYDEQSTNAPQHDLIQWTDLPIQPCLDPVHFEPENIIEEDLLISYSGLPLIEQKEITTRLEHLRLKLLSTTKDLYSQDSEDSQHNYVSTANTSRPTQLQIPAQVLTSCGMQNDRTSNINRETLEGILPCQTLKNTREECIIPAPLRNNGCVVLDSEGELNKIVNED